MLKNAAPAVRCWWAALAAASLASAAPLRLDFNDNDDVTSTTQAGWTGVTTAGGVGLGDAGVGLTLAAVGAGVVLDDRVRTTNGGGEEAALWEDFIFANGSDQAGEGMDLVVTGLQPGRAYPVVLWAFDKSSAGLRSCTWNGQPYSFNGADAAPASLAERRLALTVTADAGGALRLEGRSVATGQPHNVFLTALEIGEPLAPPTAPTDIDLEPSAVPADAPPGTPVGRLAAADPEPGDTHRFSLVAGSGSGHNDLFALAGIDGEEVRTAGPLTGLAGLTLSIRVRATDARGDWHEKPMEIRVTDDADGDGLSDTWELRHFPDLAAADGAGNNDDDELTNAQEQAAGTDPTLGDTDGDTLPDHVEDNSREFAGPGDPGSSPLLADTDGDGLRDDVEVSPADGFSTDPNRADTDGDGFDDPVELSGGTDPLNPASFPDTLMPLKISEFMAANRAGWTDGFGQREDWIEIFNPNPVAVNLDHWFLTDDEDAPAKWNFPPVSIPAAGYLVVFASGRNTVDPQGWAHTGFSLDDTGEYLALVRPDGVSVEHAWAPYPRQVADVSHGRHPADGTARFFGVPTPGAPNNAGFDGVVGDTAFSVDRGFHDAPFSLEITSPTPGATIRYTLDGTKPTPARGTVYEGPIRIDGTRVVRALAYRDGWLPTNVDTHTYLFLEQVQAQSAAPSYPPGLPPTWGLDSEVNANDGAGNGTVPADYAMDPRVVAGAQPGFTVIDALRGIPTISLSLPTGDMFGPGGIWSNPQSRGAAWEKECSVEMIEPDGGGGRTAFQEDCVVELHGNSSRRPWRMQKHSLRLTFRGGVGAGRLSYDLFPESRVKRFNKLVLRACFTDSWGLVSWDAGRYRPNDSQYFRDVWMKESLRAMGQPSSHGAFCHVYVNGLYMGLFNHTERLEDDFFADHFGGLPADWEVNADLSAPGPRWNEMLALASYDAFTGYVDLANFADYMLLHFFAGAEDWPHHNGYAATNPAIGFPYRFFSWDQEIVLDNPALNRIPDNRGAGALMQKLRTFAEFRLLFADRARRHLFNGGALTAEAAGRRYRALADRIDQAIVAESARWGDTRSSLSYGSAISQPVPLTNVNHQNYPPAPNGPAFYFTREQSWLVERDHVINHYLPSLHDTANSHATVNRLRAASLYPATAAPDFAPHGGVVAPGATVTVTAPAGTTAYVTLDGTDPRRAGTGEAVGAPSAGPLTLDRTVTLKARARHAATGEWSALTEALFVVGTPATASTLALTELHYHPAGSPDHEFLELTNISAGPIDLTGCVFTAGVEFAFASGFTLGAGGRTVVVRNLAAFEARYGAGRPVAGQFGGALDNTGETLALADAQGADIFRLRWSDAAPWPTDADGGGRSMVAAPAGPGLSLSEASAWRPSREAGGSPGSDDTDALPGDPAADADADGFAAGLEAAFGSVDTDPSDRPGVEAAHDPGDPAAGRPAVLVIRFRHAPWQAGGRLVVEHGAQLADWTSAGSSLVRRVIAQDGRVEDTWHVPVLEGDLRRFVRVRWMP